MREFVTTGIIVVDVWARPTSGFPAPGTLAFVEETGVGLGGCASNCAVSYARLGGEVGITGCVGADGFGDLALKVMGEAGVSLAVQRVPEAPTSVTLVAIADDGERTFLHCTGANGHLSPASLDMDLVCGAKLMALLGVFLMPGFDGEPQAGVLAQARQAGVTTLVDTCWDGLGRWMKLLRPLLPHTDIFLPSVGEARNLTGREKPAEMAQALLEEGVKLVGIKLGPEGSYFRTADRELRLPPYPVETVDGTGAGDAFVAGFAYGWLRGWDLEAIGRFANATGGLATTAVGTTAGVRSYEETVQLLEQWEERPWTV